MLLQIVTTAQNEWTIALLSNTICFFLVLSIVMVTIMVPADRQLTTWQLVIDEHLAQHPWVSGILPVVLDRSTRPSTQVTRRPDRFITGRCNIHAGMEQISHARFGETAQVQAHSARSKISFLLNNFSVGGWEFSRKQPKQKKQTNR